jgi:uncharacterized protein (TIGR02145 family)
MICEKENSLPCDISLCINPISYLMGLVYNAVQDMDSSDTAVYKDAFDSVMVSQGIVLSNASGKYCCPDCNTENGFYFLGDFAEFESIVTFDGLGNDKPQHHELGFDRDRLFGCCVNSALQQDEHITYKDDLFLNTTNKAVCYGYGYHYNFVSISYPGYNIANPVNGWKVPTEAEALQLVNYIGGSAEAGGKLKEKRGGLNAFQHWSGGNIGGINKYNFSALGSGYIDYLGGEHDLKQAFNMWTTTIDSANTTQAIVLNLTTAQTTSNFISRDKREGLSVRLVRVATAIELLLADGTTSESNPTELPAYVGNDGKVYTTTKIGNQIWLAENLAETYFSNGSSISYASNSNIWININTNFSAYIKFDVSSYDPIDFLLKKSPCFDLFDKTPPCCKTNFNESYQRLLYDTDLDLTTSANDTTGFSLIEGSSFNLRSGLGIMLDSLKRLDPNVTKAQMAEFFKAFLGEESLVIKCIGCDIHIYTGGGYRNYLQDKNI